MSVAAARQPVSATRWLARRDERLREAIRLVGPCTLEASGRAPYEALINAIAHQQVHGAAARAILARFEGIYAAGGAARMPSPEELLATPVERLRGAGFSTAKVLAIRDVAARAADGTIPDHAAIVLLSDEEIIERLTTVRGVGRWTAEMLLIFVLGRPDVLPVDDFGVRHGFRLLYRKRVMPKPAWLADFGTRWAPFRSTVAWYLWRYVDHLREVAKAARASAPKRRPAPAAGRGLKRTSSRKPRKP
jgi:DNA-3-methyladenine glycosylase II